MVMVGVTVVVVVAAGVTFVSTSETPESGSPSAFTVERDGDGLELRPIRIREGERFLLTVDETTVYSWESGDTETRHLRCIQANRTVRLVRDTGRRQYVNQEFDLAEPLPCGVAGGQKFAFAMVGDRQVSLQEDESVYSFTVSIDPDGPDSVGGDTDVPSTNGWHYFQRHDRELEGLSPPNFVLVFADNVGNYDADPPSQPRPYDIDDDDVVLNATGANEPANDVYVLYSPSCPPESSTLKFLGERAGYDNQILADGSVVIDNTNTALPGQEFSAPSATCVE